MSVNGDWREEADKLEELALSLGSRLKAISKPAPRRAKRIARGLLSQIELVLPDVLNGHDSAASDSQDDAGDDLEDGADFDPLTIHSSIMRDEGSTTRVIEYVLLRTLQTSKDRLNKKDLFDQLLALNLIKDNMNAFTTRLNRMKKSELITWEEARQFPAVTITNAGGEHAAKLAGGGANGLTGRQKDWISRQAPWTHG